MVEINSEREKTKSGKLWKPLRIGRLELQHRVVMSALTRARCPAGIPTSLSFDYYTQRATRGGLIISEGIHPSVMAGNYYGVPSMYAPEHIRAWKTITDAVHSKGGYIFCQLWHTGRVAVSVCLGGRKPLGPSTVRVDFVNTFTPVGPVPCEEPREMTQEDINDTIADHVHSAECAIAAGFDGVEIQGGNGYLLEQFLNSNVNNSRKDDYGGPIENRARLALEILEAVSTAIGADRVGVRFSPFNYHQMPESHSDPVPDFTWLLRKVDKLGLAYVSMMEPRSEPFVMSEAERLALQYDAARARGVPDDKLEEEVSLRPFRRALKHTAMFSSGGFNAENCSEPVEKGELDGIVFGRPFISNPDLVKRLRNGWPLASWDRKTFYTDGPVGYIDYPMWKVPSGGGKEVHEDINVAQERL